MPLELAEPILPESSDQEYLWTLNFGPQHPATHTTLRQVFDSLCAQSKWSYVQAEPGIVFIDDRSYFKNQ